MNHRVSLFFFSSAVRYNFTLLNKPSSILTYQGCHTATSRHDSPLDNHPTRNPRSHRRSRKPVKVLDLTKKANADNFPPNFTASQARPKQPDSHLQDLERRLPRQALRPCGHQKVPNPMVPIGIAREPHFFRRRWLGARCQHCHRRSAAAAAAAGGH